MVSRLLKYNLGEKYPLYGMGRNNKINNMLLNVNDEQVLLMRLALHVIPRR